MGKEHEDLIDLIFETKGYPSLFVRSYTDGLFTMSLMMKSRIK